MRQKTVPPRRVLLVRSRDKRFNRGHYQNLTTTPVEDHVARSRRVIFFLILDCGIPRLSVPGSRFVWCIQQIFTRRTPAPTGPCSVCSRYEWVAFAHDSRLFAQTRPRRLSGTGPAFSFVSPYRVSQDRLSRLVLRLGLLCSVQRALVGRHKDKGFCFYSPQTRTHKHTHTRCSDIIPCGNVSFSMLATTITISAHFPVTGRCAHACPFN